MRRCGFIYFTFFLWRLPGIFVHVTRAQTRVSTKISRALWEGKERGKDEDARRKVPSSLMWSLIRDRLRNGPPGFSASPH